MNIALIRHAGMACVAVALAGASIGCHDETHPGGGGPYVWVCTPAYFAQAGSNTRADLYVFNGSSETANIAVNILDRDGNTLAGVNVPCSTAAVTYPAQAG